MTMVPVDLPYVGNVSHLMQKCWSQNPEDRPSFDECEEQLRDVNSKSSKEDILDAITYVKMHTTTTKAKGAGSTFEGSEEFPSPTSMPTAFKAPQARSEPLLTAEASYAFDAYICYCTEDRDFVMQMEEKLENPPFGTGKKGLRLWYAERDALPAMPIYDTVREGIARSRHVVLVLTPEALISRKCTFEMEYAATLPPEARRQKVITVMYKPTDLPSWLKSMTILDYAKEERVRKDWFWVKLAKAISNQ
ncbi:myeloid differentiation primary response protein MyD88-like [Branchiostoma floridae]|nr:myeloid differentiation primary response protein MyD88-like [Branchiostoma floridae]